MDRQSIIEHVKLFYQEKHIPKTFDPSKDIFRYAGRVFDENELINLVESTLDFWLTEGRFAEDFQGKIADYLDVDNVILTNSGSSSNLLAISALTSKKLGCRQLKAGDEVITVAAGFPATVAPIIQNNLLPVFVDVDIPTYNATIKEIEKALSSKSKAIFLAHTIGNPFDLESISDFAKRHNLWLIEDNCDAFGSKFNDQPTGTFGDIATISFYPAHHITTGEGGAVITNDDQLAKIITSFRDWGRDCYCAGGENNTCGKRFTQQFGALPEGYDHKYVYSEIGYNLKMTDLQASIGSAQMDKLPDFCKKRKSNFAHYEEIFSKYSDFFIRPKALKKSDPAWFSYVLSVKDNAPFSRNELVTYLNDYRIETRNIFAGNMIRQPAFIDQNYRQVGDLKNTDFVMNNSFFLGTYPGITLEMISYLESVMDKYIKRF